MAETDIEQGLARTVGLHFKDGSPMLRDIGGDCCLEIIQIFENIINNGGLSPQAKGTQITTILSKIYQFFAMEKYKRMLLHYYQLLYDQKATSGFVYYDKGTDPFVFMAKMIALKLYPFFHDTRMSDFNPTTPIRELELAISNSNFDFQSITVKMKMNDFLIDRSAHATTQTPSQGQHQGPYAQPRRFPNTTGQPPIQGVHQGPYAQPHPSPNPTGQTFNQRQHQNPSQAPRPFLNTRQHQNPSQPLHPQQNPYTTAASTPEGPSVMKTREDTATPHFETDDLQLDQILTPEQNKRIESILGFITNKSGFFAVSQDEQEEIDKYQRSQSSRTGSYVFDIGRAFYIAARVSNQKQPAKLLTQLRKKTNSAADNIIDGWENCPFHIAPLINYLRIIMQQSSQDPWELLIKKYHASKGTNLLSKSFEGMLVGSLIAFIHDNQVSVEFERAIIQFANTRKDVDRRKMFQLLGVNISRFELVPLESKRSDLFRVRKTQTSADKFKFTFQLPITKTNAIVVDMTETPIGHGRHNFANHISGTDDEIDGLSRFILSYNI